MKWWQILLAVKFSHFIDEMSAFIQLSKISMQNQTRIFHQWEVDDSPVDPSNESVYYLEI